MHGGDQRFRFTIPEFVSQMIAQRCVEKSESFQTKISVKKKLWGNIEIKRMIRPGVKSENSVFPLQLQRVSNSNKQQICSAAEHGPRWTKCT